MPELREPPRGAFAGVPPALWLALAAGAALRLWYWRDLAAQPWYGVPLVDALSFDRAARAILAGTATGAHFRPPLYPQFLALLYRAEGPGPGVVAAAQFLLGLAALLPAYLLGERCFGRRAALAGAWVAAVYPLRIFFEGETLDVTLFGFLLLCGLWALWGAREGRSTLRALLAGLLLGLATITRPNLALALPFAALGLLLAFRGARPAGPAFWGAWLAGLAAAVIPVTAHNWRAEGAFIPVAANGGVNFYLGNAPGASGLTPLPPGLRWEAAVQEPLREGEVSLAAQQRWWTGRALHAIAEDPAGWAGLLARKALLMVSAAEPSNNKALGSFTAVSPPVRHYRWWFGALLCLAPAGFLAARRREGGQGAPRGAAFVAVFAAGYAASVTLFFVTARYRLPLVPLIAPASAAGALALGAAVRGGDRRGLAGLASALAIAAAVALPDWLGAERERISPDFQLGQVFLMRGEPERALEHLERARRADAGDPDVLNSIGAARFRLDDLAGAAAAYREALRLGEFSEVWTNLGIVAEAADPPRRAEAAAAYRRALEINPLEARAAANLEHLERGPPP